MTGAGQRKGAEVTRKKDATGLTPPRTLMEAHNALVAIRPKSGASLAVWKAYCVSRGHQRSDRRMVGLMM
ncbi:MAG: hypothetical protein ACRD1T_01360 [Acidimicrobiia bacterium]